MWTFKDFAVDFCWIWKLSLIHLIRRKIPQVERVGMIFEEDTEGYDGELLKGALPWKGDFKWYTNLRSNDFPSLEP